MYAPFGKTQCNSKSYQDTLDDINQWATDNNMTINTKVKDTASNSVKA